MVHFKIIATVLALINGQPTDDGARTFSNHVQFDSEDACMNFFDTPEGAASRAALEAFVASAGDGDHKIEFKCVPTREETL